jgi:hypothetical protein
MASVTSKIRAVPINQADSWTARLASSEHSPHFLHGAYLIRRECTAAITLAPIVGCSSINLVPITVFSRHTIRTLHDRPPISICTSVGSSTDSGSCSRAPAVENSSRRHVIGSRPSHGLRRTLKPSNIVTRELWRRSRSGAGLCCIRDLKPMIIKIRLPTITGRNWLLCRHGPIRAMGRCGCPP